MVGFLRSTPWRRVVEAGALAWVLAVSSLASAQVVVDPEAKAEARQNAIDGQKAFDVGDYATAAYRLGLAFEVMPVPTVGVRYARALARLGQLREAAQIYEKVVAFDPSRAAADPELQTQAQAEARQDLPALEQRIPVVTVQLQGAVPADREAVEISIGDEVVAPESWSSAPVNPGTHTVKARRNGQVIAARRVSLKEAERRTVVLTLSTQVGSATPRQDVPPGRKGDSTSPPSHRTRAALMWTALGVGAAGFLVGGVTGGIVLAKKSQLDSSGDCEGSGRDTECSASSDLDAYNTLRPVSTVGFVVGFVGAGIGTTLLLTHPSREHGVQARIGPGSIELVGHFH